MRIEAMRYQTLLALLPLCVVSLAHAHAILDHADPRVGSVVASAPAKLSLWFTQEVEPAFSHVEVRDVNGARVDEDSVQGDSADATLLRIALKPLPPGSYEVRWHVLSADTHTTEGHFRFDVGQ
jgi:methionine-rich copper-binding protein CopC